MARYSAGTVSAGAGSTTLPVGGLTAGASNDIYVLEIGAFNTTATAVDVAVRRMTAIGTPGATVTAIPWDPDTTAATGVPKDTWTVTGTFTAGNLRAARLGAAIGAGVIWTFSGSGLRIPKGTANGIVLIPSSGTGQVLEWYVDWQE